jgi:hypothetical protein
MVVGENVQICFAIFQKKKPVLKVFSTGSGILTPFVPFKNVTNKVACVYVTGI